jgi:hypothetical protein
VPSAIMKVWVVVTKVPEIQARSIEKVFDSKEKAFKYVTEQESGEMPPNLSGFEHNVEEWEVE